MHFPFIFQPSDKPTCTHSTELFHFNERASLRSGLPIDRRYRRPSFMTVDLCILLTTSVCPYPPCIFIERVYHKPSISISLLYTVGSCDNFIAYVPFIILSHHYIQPKFQATIISLYHGLFDPLLGRGVTTRNQSFPIYKNGK